MWKLNSDIDQARMKCANNTHGNIIKYANDIDILLLLLLHMYWLCAFFFFSL